MAVQEKLYTAEDLWEMSHRPEYAGRRLVLIEGVIHEMAPAGWLHGDLALEIGRVIGNYVKENRLGRVTAAETGFILAPDTTLAPDVGFVAAARVPDLLPTGYVPFAPDLAVEIVSPGNAALELSAKVEQYIRHGTRLVWVVYPEKQRVHVYRAARGRTATVEFLGLEDALDGDEVLPGFGLKLRDLFGKAGE